MNHLPFYFRLGDGKVSEADSGEPRMCPFPKPELASEMPQGGEEVLGGISMGRPSRG